MFCPKCGNADQTPNAYCRSCGEWLPDGDKLTKTSFGGDTPQQNIFNTLFLSGLSVLFALFAAIALYANHLGRSGVNWSVYVAAAFLLTIAGWQISNFYVALKLRSRIGRKRNGEQKKILELSPNNANAGLPAADTANLVVPHSVIERTTELLPIAKRGAHD